MSWSEAVFIDLGLFKASDTINHSGVLCKLPYYEICDTELKWFTDYLFFGRQSVQCNGVLSEPNPVFTGVTQGPSLVQCCSLSILTMQISLFSHLELTWYHKNELIVSLNKGKTESMTFGTAKSLNRLQGRQLNLMINELHINSTTSYRYFDIHLDPLVNFETHFSKTCKKAAGRVNLLRKIRSSITCAAA